MYGLYSAYGGKMAKIYWWLFRNNKIVRQINAIDENELDFPYTQIKDIVGTNALMSFNMGSPGEEQKVSILGYDNQTKQPFFAKFAQKPKAMELSKNEINILIQLEGSGFTPLLLDSRITSEYVYLKTEYIKGNRLENTALTKQITELSIRLSQMYFMNDTNSDLQISMSHGDFCPWNFLENEGVLRLIDWEMAKARPLGYDLFTYIFQPSFLLYPKKSIEDVLQQNTTLIKYYFNTFGIKNWNNYLTDFTNTKLVMETQKNNIKLTGHYQRLKNYVETLNL
jgi:tRNA A-37 threonylcarbamoyl transferase component Bud32